MLECTNFVLLCVLSSCKKLRKSYQNTEKFDLDLERSDTKKGNVTEPNVRNKSLSTVQFQLP